MQFNSYIQDCFRLSYIIIVCLMYLCELIIIADRPLSPKVPFPFSVPFCCFKGRRCRGFKPRGGGVRESQRCSVPMCPFLLVFWGFFRLFQGFSRLVLLDAVPLSRPVERNHQEHSRKGPGHNQDLSRKRGTTAGLGNPMGEIARELSQNPWQNKPG